MDCLEIPDLQHEPVRFGFDRGTRPLVLFRSELGYLPGRDGALLAKALDPTQRAGEVRNVELCTQLLRHGIMYGDSSGKQGEYFFSEMFSKERHQFLTVQNR